MTRVVLASASPRRRELLAALVPAFEVAATDIPEPLTGDPERDARSLALAKALAGAAAAPGAVVIGADTIVADADSSYGKPRDAADARAMWFALRGKPHRVVTGIAVAEDRDHHAELSVSTVGLTALDDRAVDAYIASGRPLDKAGAYAIQDEDVPTVTSLEGCYCGVMGLPLWKLHGLLLEHRVECGDPSITFERCAACPERR